MVSTSQPAEIGLPEDDADAMSDMCTLLHGIVITKFMSPYPPQVMLRLARVVDKYACASALRLHSQGEYRAVD
jgi:hypothetical protein